MLRMLNQQGSHWTIACWNRWIHQRYADEPLTEASYHPATWGFFKVLKEEREKIPKIPFGGFSALSRSVFGLIKRPLLMSSLYGQSHGVAFAASRPPGSNWEKANLIRRS